MAAQIAREDKQTVRAYGEAEQERRDIRSKLVHDFRDVDAEEDALARSLVCTSGVHLPAYVHADVPTCLAAEVVCHPQRHPPPPPPPPPHSLSSRFSPRAPPNARQQGGLGLQTQPSLNQHLRCMCTYVRACLRACVRAWTRALPCGRSHEWRRRAMTRRGA